MAGLKELRRHKQSVSSIHKLTSAMKMVSSAKFSKYQIQWRESLNCLAESKSLAERLYTQADLYNSYPLYLQRRSKALPTLLVIFSSDRGLCGGFNLRLFKAAQGFIQKHHAMQCDVRLICIGQKAAQFFSADSSVIHVYTHWTGTYAEILPLLEFVSTSYKNEEICDCVFLYNAFHNAIQQESHFTSVLPIHLEYHLEGEVLEGGLLEYSPSFKDVFEEALDILFRTHAFSIIKEHYVSEHSGRMAAMETATENADALLKELTLDYNRLRQSLITTQLIEIISGAEAL